MRYIYMHNYRGFSDTLIPLSQTSFLVGENSTGKSSFLKLLYLISRPEFWFYPEFSLQKDHELGGFHDIVSAWAEDKSYFEVGVVAVDNDKKLGRNLTFTVLTFIDKGGTPQLSRYTQLADKKLITLTFENKRTRFKIEDIEYAFSSSEEAVDYFRELLPSERAKTTGFKLFPKEIPLNPPLPIAISILRSMGNGKIISRSAFHADIPYATELAWIAPIRTKPRRFYDGLKQSFSPEGDHAPFLLRRLLRTSTKSARFTEKLTAFGQASGLFEMVKAHSFSKSPQAPFELLIKFSGAELNINNVGYGVSQVLPLIVEFLSREKKMTFAVQQPEVHLHPRAQAALGGLIFELAKERDHSFVLETHSDYLIDRFRLLMSTDKSSPKAQVIFFHRVDDGNHASIVPISPDGRYPENQPKEFREFFIKEEMMLLEI